MMSSLEYIIDQLRVYVDRCFNSYLFFMSGFILIVLQY